MAIGLGSSYSDGCDNCSYYYSQVLDLGSCLKDIKDIIDDKKMTDTQKLIELKTLLRNQK